MRTLLVEGDKTFKIIIPEDAKITYGPWAPPKGEKGWNQDPGNKRGTLRIYQADGKSIIACFAGVTNFRDVSLIEYAEQVAKEEGASIWKSDREGYRREDRLVREHEWIDPMKQLPEAKKGKGKK
jgi:hypothetical protein